MGMYSTPTPHPAMSFRHTQDTQAQAGQAREHLRAAGWSFHALSYSRSLTTRPCKRAQHTSTHRSNRGTGNAGPSPLFYVWWTPSWSMILLGWKLQAQHTHPHPDTSISLHRACNSTGTHSIPDEEATCGVDKLGLPLPADFLLWGARCPWSLAAGAPAARGSSSPLPRPLPRLHGSARKERGGSKPRKTLRRRSWSTRRKKAQGLPAAP